MSKQDDGSTAFPATDPCGEQYSGMTLLDWFAGQALMADFVEDDEMTVADAAEELGINAPDYNGQLHWPQVVAKRCYNAAAAMIAEKRRREATP